MLLPTVGQRNILTVNRGSGTLKAGLYQVNDSPRLVLSIQVDRAGTRDARIWITSSSSGTLLDSGIEPGQPNSDLSAILKWLSEHGYTSQLVGIGHRLVHGGPRYTEAQRITPEVLAELQRLAPLDPEHTPEAIRNIQFFADKLPNTPQIACFDTAFHASLPKVARMYALPREMYEEGIRRYGFHGLSCEYILQELRATDAALAEGRLVIAHLGNGCSMTAVHNGKSIDTSMGFTPLEGLVMGTRTGDIDPAVVVYLQEQDQMSPEDINTLLNKKSGLLGVSGTSADMRDLLEREAQDSHAAEAIELFCYRAKKYVGAYAAALGGLDGLIFAGGIGENAPRIRERICSGLEFLGIELDPSANGISAETISSPRSRVSVKVIKTDEDAIIVQQVLFDLAKPQEVPMFVFDAKLSTVVDGTPSSAGTSPPPAKGPLSNEMLGKMQRYWQAANYLTIGQIYLQENALLREPLRAEHIKPRLLGHWGTSPGLSFIYVHLNRLIREKDANVLYVAGPGHGGPALNANSYLEGTYSSVRPEITEDAAGMRLFFREFSTPGGVPSHCGPHVPNSIHEGGELGYSLLHAFGAAFDNPDLIVVCVVGDGEAETCPLEGSWKGNCFLSPITDGAVLPILHLNGYKISGPTVQGRTSDDELIELYKGHGYMPYFLEGDDPPYMHQEFARLLDQCYADIREIQSKARSQGFKKRPCWPMIVLRTPKGWTGPKEVDGVPIEGTFRAHQVPLATVRENPKHLRLLEAWLKSYQPDELFDASGHFVSELSELAPTGSRRMGATPHANGGRVLVPLNLPDFENYALEVPAPGTVIAEPPRKLGEFIRDIIKMNPNIFRLFCPDETNSNRLNAVFEATDRRSMEETVSIDDHVSPQGRVLEVLSEHCCQGWLEGYLLTGRHGLWSSYEAFAQVVDSMLTQHAKWIEEAEELPWRKPIASLNVFITSHAWRNDHNGFSHQAPGFVDNALARRSTVIRTYYPPDANCLLSAIDHCLRSRNYVNVVTCGKQETLQWLTMDQAVEHCSRGASIWKFASNDDGNPDIVLACVGDVPTLETVAASWLLQKYLPEIRVRVVNVMDLAVLMSPQEHPHGMDNLYFEELFTDSAPVLFAHHGYRWSIHSMIHGRPNEARFHVRGFIDQGSTTTPFDMVVRNKISRLQLALDTLRYVPRLRSKSSDMEEMLNRKLYEHEVYIREHFEDLPDITLWRWTSDFSESTEPLPLAKGQPRSALFTDS